MLLSPSKIYADEYVLPYPSDMPGSKLYTLGQIVEYISKYWYFGDFAQFEYNLNLSDKYLVEAKILFEYKQYLLALDALNKSNSYFTRLEDNLTQASRNGKEISKKKEILQNASQKHRETLTQIKLIIPETSLWVTEQSSPKELFLHNSINNALNIRNNNE